MARALGNTRATHWRRRIQLGLGPLTVGLMLASGLVLARSADHSLAAGAVTLATLLVLLRTKIHPLLLMGVGAVLGLLGLI